MEVKGVGELAIRQAHNLGKEQCELRSRKPVQELLPKVRGLLQGEWRVLNASQSGPRRGVGGLHGHFISSRQVRRRGREDGRSGRVPSAGRQGLYSKVQTGLERMEKAGSTRQTAAIAEAGRGLRHVPEARGRHGLKGEKHYGACGKCWPPSTSGTQ